MSDSADEYQQLAKRYSGMYDDELLKLASEYDDLTDTAQLVLRDELLRRKLEAPKPSAEPAEEDHTGGEPIALDLDVSPDGNVLIGNFQSTEQATIAYWALEIAGIPSKLIMPPSGPSSIPRLQVAPEDAGRAQQILAQPASDEVMDQYESAKQTGDFETPDCPVCGTPDPLLESADPVNEWFCESCGHQWKDAQSATT
jgi:hypothetical protein